MSTEAVVGTLSHGSPLGVPVTTLLGVGPERAGQLGRVGISTVEDLLLHSPRRYEDRRHFRPIARLRAGDAALTRGKVVALGVKWFRAHTKSVCELILDDGTARLHCRWWNLPFMEKYFKLGDEVVASGKVVSAKPRTMDHPETEVVKDAEEAFLHLNRITPIYPLTEGLPQRWLRSLIWRTLEANESRITEPWPALNHSLAAFPTRARAIRSLHFPESFEQIEPARRRLALDEFLELQRGIQLRRRNFETKAAAVSAGGDNRLIRPFLAALGFKLTRAQTEVLRELRRDMSGAHPMRRLLQGDVGSGKTVVAACCALMALESGYDVGLMAPTEILAEQHFANFAKWLAPLGVRVELRTGSRKAGAQEPGPVGVSPASFSATSPSTAAEKVRTDPDAARPRLTVGTHALIQEGFGFDNLGLVIIDEQHRFGVAQREELVRKGRYPHLLVMTATPIPRTLGLTLYGDLDVSVISQPPPGRGRIKTFIRGGQRLPKVWAFIREKLAEGRQAYVVCPRIEDSGQPGIKAVTQELELVRGALKPFEVGLLHGRLKPREKEEVMARFRAKGLHVLLATSLIEVGVDIPNATVMLIENAEQFGLAQLHQLRGRIGRGAHDSYCILLTGSETEAARQRLNILEETTDGFQIAEADLKLRGPGELLGQQQSGLPRLRFGDLVKDFDLVREARQLAAQTLASPVAY